MVKLLIDTRTPGCPELNFAPPLPAAEPACSLPHPGMTAHPPGCCRGPCWLCQSLLCGVRVQPLPPLDGIAEHLPLGFPDFCPASYAQFSVQQPEWCFSTQVRCQPSAHKLCSPPLFPWEQKPELCNRLPQGARDPGASPQLTDFSPQPRSCFRCFSPTASNLFQRGPPPSPPLTSFSC